MEITPGTFFYGQWKEVTTPTYISYWFYNVTNKEEFLKGGVKPVVHEIGPYTYRYNIHLSSKQRLALYMYV